MSFDDALAKAKKTREKIKPKLCKAHGEDLVNTCGDCARYVGEWLAWSYLDTNIEMTERSLDFDVALREFMKERGIK